MTPRRLTAAVALAVALALGAWYLHDPPWVADVTSGLLNWEDEGGTRLRWTVGHASWFVPTAATAMTLPMRAFFPGTSGPVIVSISVDDWPVADIALDHPKDWESSTVLIPQVPTHRGHRRVDLRVNRTVPPFNLGVELGVVKVQ